MGHGRGDVVRSGSVGRNCTLALMGVDAVVSIGFHSVHLQAGFVNGAARCAARDI